MKEELLHFYWQSKVLTGQELQLIDGQKLLIRDFGFHNKNSGPDFSNASIRIDESLWYGHVEIHIQSSDWYAHHHQLDPAYENVILHVVYHHDRDVLYAGGDKIPTLELRTLLPPVLLKRFAYLQDNKNEIPCEKIFVTPTAIERIRWLDRLMCERLERKAQTFKHILEACKNDWENAFYRFLAYYMGSPVNAHPFEWMASKVNLSQVAKCRNDPTNLLALFMGISGLLPEYDGNDKAALITSYSYLKKKFNLSEIPLSIWKFSRTRPANFPPVRIRQFAALLEHSEFLFTNLMACKTIGEMENLIRRPDIATSPFPEGFVDHLIINVVLPARTYYLKTMRQQPLHDDTLDLLNEMPSENNKIVRFWKSLGISSSTALDSQALLELKSSYCDRLKCVDCAFGKKILLNETFAG